MQKAANYEHRIYHEAIDSQITLFIRIYACNVFGMLVAILNANGKSSFSYLWHNGVFLSFLAAMPRMMKSMTQWCMLCTHLCINRDNIMYLLVTVFA